jgi:hypothetical protein
VELAKVEVFAARSVRADGSPNPMTRAPGGMVAISAARSGRRDGPAAPRCGQIPW